MIQFNLLPDIKQEYLKAQRQKHLVMFIATIAAIAGVTLFIILVLVVDVWQKKTIGDLNHDVKMYSSQLTGTKDLNKILTVQNQLGSLTALHDQKAAASKLFGYITQVTPAAVNISKVNVDFTLHTLTISGATDAVSAVNTYADTLKFTSFKVDNKGVSKDAFSGVVTSFTRTAKTTTYTLTSTFDPAIFSQAGDATLTVPQKTTTRSSTEQPLFINNSSNQ